MKTLFKKLLAKQNLEAAEAEELMDLLTSGSVAAEQMGFLLAAFEFKGVTGVELAGFVCSLLRKSNRVELLSHELVDVCGTGGDGLSQFNVSTCVSFVVAAAGIKIAKHGNRAVSSRCGSFDVLEELDIAVSHNAHEAQISMNNNGLAFLFAPSFHPILAVLAPIRRSLGVRTVFNILGPLLNPARVKRQLVGVYSRELMRPVAEALQILGSEEVMVVHGADGNDEISLTAKTYVAHLKNNLITQYEINPEELGFSNSEVSALAGGDAKENANLLKKVLSGTKGPCRDITLLNAGAALMIGGKAQDLASGIKLAAATIDQGQALQLLIQSQRIHSAQVNV